MTKCIGCASVPDNLRKLLGKREDKCTLGIRYPEEVAKRRHVEALAESRREARRT
jgi:hypothetical protein